MAQGTCPVCLGSNRGSFGPTAPCVECIRVDPSLVRTTADPHQREIYRRALLNRYYRLVSADPSFQEAFRELRAHIPQRLWSRRFDELEGEARAVRPNGFQSTEVTSAYDSIQAFATSWPLPRDGARDIWDSLSDDGEHDPPRIRRDFIRWGEVAVGRVVSSDVLEAGHEAPVRLEKIRPVIVPPQLDSFEYDPSRQQKGWLRARARELAERVYREVVNQAEAFETQAAANGYIDIPPQHRSPEDLDRLALRLFRAAWLTWPWQKIADAESREAGTFVSQRTVISTVGHWGDLLAITLPKRSTGRRRKVTS